MCGPISPADDTTPAAPSTSAGGSGQDSRVRSATGPETVNGLYSDTRGVQWTLEAFLAVLLLLSALVVVAAVLPVGTQQAEAELAQTQLQQAGDDVLELAATEGDLTAAVLYYNTTEAEFAGTETDLGGESHYVSFDGDEDHPLAPLLAGTVGERALAYNIHIEYEADGPAPERRPLVYQGPPGGDSVTATATVVLSEDDVPHASPGNCTLAALDAGACGDETFYAPNADDTAQYNTVQVALELWRA